MTATMDFTTRNPTRRAAADREYDNAISDFARGDERPLLTQAASYFVGIHALTLSVICRGDASGLPGRERSSHDSQASAGTSISVRRAARSEQVRRIDAHKARKRNVVGPIVWGRFESAFVCNAIVPFHAPRTERNRIGRAAAGQHVLPLQLTDAVDMAALPRPKLRTRGGEVCALPARQLAQYFQVLPRLLPAACLCSGQTSDIARIVVKGHQICDDVPGNRQPRNYAPVLRQPSAVAAIVVVLGCANRRLHAFRRNIRIGCDATESRSERAKINRAAVAVTRRGAAECGEIAVAAGIHEGVRLDPVFA